LIAPVPQVVYDHGLMTDRSDASPTIFVVDDDAGMRAALQRLFRAAGLQVETYPSAQELLDTCDLARPGLLLLDVMMPAMTGLELQAVLLERRVDLPIVFLTASHSVPMAVDAMRRGAADFLEKPFENATLVERVRQALQRVAGKPAARVSRVEYERRRGSLTPREREVMEHVVAGGANKVIARALGASHRTVEIHRTRVMEKMQAESLADLVGMALAHSGH
jgi:two-component system, LuxR family, response regulator FixJ